MSIRKKISKNLLQSLVKEQLSVMREFEAEEDKEEDEGPDLETIRAKTKAAEFPMHQDYRDIPVADTKTGEYDKKYGGKIKSRRAARKKKARAAKATKAYANHLKTVGSPIKDFKSWRSNLKQMGPAGQRKAASNLNKIANAMQDMDKKLGVSKAQIKFEIAYIFRETASFYNKKASEAKDSKTKAMSMVQAFNAASQAYAQFSLGYNDESLSSDRKGYWSGKATEFKDFVEDIQERAAEAGDAYRGEQAYKKRHGDDKKPEGEEEAPPRVAEPPEEQEPEEEEPEEEEDPTSESIKKEKYDKLLEWWRK